MGAKFQFIMMLSDFKIFAKRFGFCENPILRKTAFKIWVLKFYIRIHHIHTKRLLLLYFCPVLQVFFFCLTVWSSSALLMTCTHTCTPWLYPFCGILSCSWIQVLSLIYRTHFLISCNRHCKEWQQVMYKLSKINRAHKGCLHLHDILFSIFCGSSFLQLVCSSWFSLSCWSYFLFTRRLLFVENRSTFTCIGHFHQVNWQQGIKDGIVLPQGKEDDN